MRAVRARWRLPGLGAVGGTGGPSTSHLRVHRRHGQLTRGVRTPRLERGGEPRGREGRRGDRPRLAHASLPRADVAAAARRARGPIRRELMCAAGPSKLHHNSDSDDRTRLKDTAHCTEGPKRKNMQ